MERVVVARSEELPENGMLAVQAHGLQLVLFRSPDGQVSVLEDRCSHARVKLSRGSFDGATVQCPAHGAKFDVKTGKHLTFPAVAPVRAFGAEELDGQIAVLLPSA
jgi:3-phenylpropionate/trans-cinnamate dioxygenase ferredoxin subunit